MKSILGTLSLVIGFFIVGSLARAEELALEPWLPRQLADWPALVTEIKEYAGSFNDAQRQSKSDVYYQILPDEKTDMGFRNYGVIHPSPPKEVQASDVISYRIWVCSGNNSGGCGSIIFWRALKLGAAGGCIIAPLRGRSGATIYPGLAGLGPKIEAEALSRQDLVDTWSYRTFDLTAHDQVYVASWIRTNDRARVRDDSEPDKSLLMPARIGDLGWLKGPPASLVPPLVPSIAPDAYARRIAVHAAVQRALSCLRWGIPSRALVISKIDENSLAKSCGIQPGDMPIAVNNTTFVTRTRFNTLVNAVPPGELTLKMARYGSVVESRSIGKGGLGIEVHPAPPDPGLAVLGEVAEIDKNLVIDAAAAMYALDCPDIAAEGLRRLENHLPKMHLAFIRAWQAASAGDFGLADALLADQTDRPTSYLTYEIQSFKVANRDRSARFLWARPDLGESPDAAGLIRRLINSAPENERFLLFEGKVASTLFPLNGVDAFNINDPATRLVQASGGSLVSTPSDRQQWASFAAIPERMEMSWDFTIAPVIRTPADSDFAPPTPYFSIEFQTVSARLTTSAGLGQVRIHPNGLVSCIAPRTIPEDLFDQRECEPVPVTVAFDGVTYNSVRIVRLSQCVRIEINGQFVMQGFLPLTNPPDTPNAQTIGLNFVAQDVVYTFKNGRVFKTKDPTAKSNF